MSRFLYFLIFKGIFCGKKIEWNLIVGWILRLFYLKGVKRCIRDFVGNIYTFLFLSYILYKNFYFEVRMLFVL